MKSAFKSLNSVLVLSLAVHVGAVLFIGFQTQVPETKRAIPSTFSLMLGSPKKFGTEGSPKKVPQKEIITEAPALKTQSMNKNMPVDEVSAVQSSPNAPIGNGGSEDGTGTTQGNGGSVNGSDSPLARYGSMMLEVINKQKKYPRMARVLRQEGHVIDKQGNVRDVKIVKEATFKTLTDAALETIKTIKKFPPFPNDIGKEEMVVNIPVEYKLI
jgi:TonB family protein